MLQVKAGRCTVRDISTASSREAVLVGDAFFELSRYDAAATLPMHRELATYVHRILSEEWALLSEHDRLHHKHGRLGKGPSGRYWT